MKTNRKTNVLFIHHQKHIGGGQTYVNELLNQFNIKGNSTSLLENQTPIEIIKYLILTKTKFAIWSVYSEFPLFPFILSFLLGKKNLIILYGVWILETRSSYWKDGTLESGLRLKQQEIKVWIKQFTFCLLSSGIAHLSLYAQDLFNSTFRVLKFKKQTIIFGGADRQIFKPITRSARIKMRRQLGINNDDIVLLMTGRVEKRKNYIEGLQILKQLKKQIPNKNIYLYFVLSYGKFNDLMYLDQIFIKIKKLNLGSFVRIISGVSKEQVAHFYQVADVYLMLSKELETFGLVTLEALSSGCPVFGYEACATPEIISIYKKQFLFPPGNKSAISKAITDYLFLPQKRKQLLQKNLTDSTSRFSWLQSSNRIVEMIASLQDKRELN